MNVIIDLAECAPRHSILILDVAEFTIKNYFVPALRDKLELEKHTLNQLWLDFKDFEKLRYAHEVVTEEILQLMRELNMERRVAFMNIPNSIYTYMQSRCNEGVMLITRYEYK